MEMRHLSSILVLLLLFGVVSESRDLTSDVRSLLEFKKGIRSDPTGRVSDSWDSASLQDNGCPVDWHGVICSDDGFISVVNLEGLGLAGDLKFSTLCGLKSLRNLSLANNALTGRLVPAIGGMTSLQHFDLSGNGFYGPVPARIAELWGLSHLNLSFNNFTGAFPKGLQNLQQLKVLDLHSNGLYGDLGVFFSELRNTEFVDLSCNAFYGQLFMDSNNLSSLANTVRHVNLSHNSLNGGFFSSDSMKLFRNLEVLDVGHNQISGPLPSFASLPSLGVIRMGNNQFDGSLPPELFGSSLPLTELDLSKNGFSGAVLNLNSTTLRSLNLSGNRLSGSLPSNLGSCLILDLSNNGISGDMSPINTWGDAVELVDLSSNLLSGSFPDRIGQFANLASIKIRNNSLEGAIPPSLGTYPRLSTLDLSGNELTSSIPESFFTSLALRSLNLSRNRLTGSIPIRSSHSIESLVLPSGPGMEFLDLSCNSLMGNLPSEVGNMERLKLLNLGKNHLSGTIPSELSKLSFLESLDLSSNSFRGELPDRLSPNLKTFNVSYNNLSGYVPENLRDFPITSFLPGNNLLVIYPNSPQPNRRGSSGINHSEGHHPINTSIKVVIVVGCVGSLMLIAFVLLAYIRTQQHEFQGTFGFSGQSTGREGKLAIFTRPSLFGFHKNVDPEPTSLGLSNDQLLPSHRSLSKQTENLTEIATCGSDVGDGIFPPTSGWKSSPASPLSSPHYVESCVPEQPVPLSVYSPDRLAGELYFLDSSLVFTAEELSRAPAEVLGRSSHGTLYKATLDGGHLLTVKWLRVGLVKRKKEFAKEVKRIGSIRHPNLVSLRAYYWGPREQERLILADYINGDSLALHLYEATPRRHSPLSFAQRLKVAVDVARCLYYLHHDKGLPHGNLKPTNILLVGPDLTAQLTDYGLHRLMTPVGTAEQILNLGAHGYRAPELATAIKPVPSFKADVYAFGVILMELLTRRSAGDIISGQSSAVDLTDWVRLCASEGRGTDCFDRDITCLEEAPRAMDELLAVSLRCILPVNERPNIKTVFEDLCSIQA
ncbi:probable inactive receptor kinase At5g10020 [Aristolochia californica]|uniref:probable inactive receptor kinase At5g10020 n=1 Tax=Aristolochia californica TaxID=171875 RepID=UPI0035DA0FB9